MDFAADFTAIDFETASRRADSACQLAAVIVREGRIADEAMWMIRPEPFYFSRSNVQIHGITPQQVREEPVFGDLWSEIAEKLTCDCLVAHNANFDIGVLLACLRAHNQTIPDLQFTCTRAIARRTWPHHRRYGLKPLSNWLGIRFRHHDALEDSIACAKILLAAGIDREADSLEDLEKRLKLSRGKAGDWGYRGPTGRSAGKRSRPSRNAKNQNAGAQNSGAPNAQLPFLFPGQVAAPQTEYRVNADTHEAVDLQRLMIRAEFIRPLLGMRVVFSGRLRSVSQQEAESLATRLGGTCQARVDESTDFLVVGRAGGSDRSNVGAEGMGAEQKAREFLAKGKPIRIVNEEEFIGLVISPATDS
jgi:DNA polymerase-3 subunit epsilon